MGPVGDQARGDSSVDWETKQAEIQSARARRAADTSNSQELVAEVTRVHFDADPIGINFETNIDEYAAEAETIVINLPRVAGVADTQALVHETFRAWFGPSSAGSSDRYAGVAVEIWIAWCRTRDAPRTHEGPRSCIDQMSSGLKCISRVPARATPFSRNWSRPALDSRAFHTRRL